MGYSNPGYKPGEPYEFPDTLWNEAGLMRYRCFRGSCAGRNGLVSAVLTSDRNSHNGYHNRRGE